ncbi:redoxin domain-containing protein [Planococcus halotolerans]|uniref:TlpA family protein disulfide reductase n=1 Tax=Planococcus halotolerans TaxID=2233542 RepID=A0A365L385_9BACL|nr:redoxin domain-containing protein [Planococcus halotolerans]QHJ70724.1 redoxin domain-containing protein [Planococcus halotolerans]RAZ79519.1 TlpA family protein disulfide reductase [Planococcus halotolerans]
MKRILGLLLVGALIVILVVGIVQKNVEERQATDRLNAGSVVDFLPTDEGLAKGETAPDFELTTLAGESVRLSDYKGKKVILNFWATWCPPCRAEMPDMQKYYDEQADGENVEILAVNLTTADKGMDKINAFVEEFSLTFPVPMDTEGEIGDLYQAASIPTSYMIDTEGRVQQKIVGPMNEEMMEEFIADME